MSRIQQVSRRDFLERAFSAGAFVLGVQVLPLEAKESAWNPNVYLGIDSDGTITIIAHRSEMGTGIRTVLPSILAAELDADWKRVKIEHAIGDEKFGNRNTDGSCSIRDFYDAMREAGASARLMLERAASAKWNEPPTECQAKLHEVLHANSGRKLGYGELASLAAKQAMPKKEELHIKSPSEFRYMGKDVPMTDLDDIVTGKGTFGMDASMPGMVYASIERSPVYGGKLKSFDDKEARKVTGHDCGRNGHRQEERHLQCDAIGRRIRTQVETGLCCRSGDPFKEGRQAG
jgi:isoquinoline 1-oxidoreductase subunit beta